MSFGRAQFLVAQWPSFVPAVSVFLTAVICGHFLIKWKKPDGYVVVGQESFEANKMGKSKFWKACLCGAEPQSFPWWVLGIWDFIDWFLYVVWFLVGKPSNGSNAEFAHDYVVAWGCSALIWFGGVLPSLMWVLPRQWYIGVEVIYDGLEMATVWYVTQTYDFKADVSGRAQWSTILAFLNGAATVIDTLMFKGPEFLDSALSFFSCCVNYRLKESQLTQDVAANEHQVFLQIEAYLVFKTGDTILINDNQHIVTNLLTNSIYIKPPTLGNHSTGDVVRLKIRDGEEIQHDVPATSGPPSYAPMVPSPSSPRVGDPGGPAMLLPPVHSEMPPLLSSAPRTSADPGTGSYRMVHRQSPSE